MSKEDKDFNFWNDFLTSFSSGFHDGYDRAKQEFNTKDEGTEKEKTEEILAGLEESIYQETEREIRKELRNASRIWWITFEELERAGFSRNEAVDILKALVMSK